MTGGGPIVTERQTTGCRVRVEASNPRRTPGGALAVDVLVTMYGESIAGTVVLLAADYGPPWVSAHGPLLAAIRALPSGTYLEVAEVIEDAASRVARRTLVRADVLLASLETKHGQF